MPKERNHNEWFQPLSTKRKSCPTCHAKLEPGETAHAWGEYVRAKWHTVKHFCKSCFADEVLAPLLRHTGDCGCVVTVRARSGYSLPEWLKLPEPETCEVK